MALTPSPALLKPNTAMFRHKQAGALRRIVGISEHEDIVVLMSIGHPAPGWRYAASPRSGSFERAA